jgi:hypothetical protein
VKIVSKYKDYYDYCSTQFGVDTNTVYLRNKISLEGAKKQLNFEFSYDLLVPLKVQEFKLNFNRGIEDIQIKYLFVCGKQYLCFRKNIKQKFDISDKWTSWKIYNPETDAGIFQIVKKELLYWWWSPINEKDFIPKWNDQLVEVSRILQQPVFFVDGYITCNGFTYSKQHKVQTNGVYVYVNEDIPRLSELGFAAIYPAERLYQELDYYLGNILKDNLDIVPPVTIADKDLIVSKGFDLKQSFRKRKRDEGKN